MGKAGLPRTLGFTCDDPNNITGPGRRSVLAFGILVSPEKGNDGDNH